MDRIRLLTWEHRLGLIERVYKDRLITDDHYADNGGYVWVDPVLTSVGLVDPVTRTMPAIFDGSSIKVREKGVLVAQSSGVIIASTITVPVGEIWEVVGAYAEFKMDANAAARTVNVQINAAASSLLGLPTAGAIGDFTAITLQLSEEGSFYLPEKAYHWTNTHGVVAKVADENTVPFFVNAGATIAAAVETNFQVGDQTGLSVFYKKGTV